MGGRKLGKASWRKWSVSWTWGKGTEADGKSKVATEMQRHESRTCLENWGLASVVGGRGRVRSGGKERW